MALPLGLAFMWASQRERRDPQGEADLAKGPSELLLCSLHSLGDIVLGSVSPSETQTPLSLWCHCSGGCHTPEGGTELSLQQHSPG